MSGFTDIHTHFVYGVDDGARTMREMTDLLDASYAQGVTTLYGTSHAELGMRPFHMEEYQEHLREARQYCRDQGYDMTLLPGAELLYTPAMDAWIRDRKLITLGEKEDLVLVECVPDVTIGEMSGMLEKLEEAGYRTILAHIERYACMKGRFPYQLKGDYDVQYQVNCRTAADPKGLLLRRRVNRWFRDGIIDYVASDMHNCASRSTTMQATYQALCRTYDPGYADWLMKSKDFHADENGLK